MADPAAATRALWDLAPGVVHLNHGSFGAVPRPVREAQDRLRAELDGNPMRFFRRELPGRLEAARGACATFLQCDPAGFAFVPNVMTGVNTVLAAVALGAGDEVVLTEHAYGGIVLAVRRACERAGAVVRTARFGLDSSGEQQVAAVLAEVTDRTRLVVVEHITSATAVVLPVERLVALLRQRDVEVLVDAAHAIVTVPLDVGRLGADYWVGSLHKWACAPPGAAALVVADRRRERVAPIVTSWGATDPFPRSFDLPGTIDPSPYLVAPTALAFLEDLGLDRLRGRNAALVAEGSRRVAEALGTGDRLPGGTVAWMRLVPLPGEHAMDVPAVKALQDRIADELGIELVGVSWRDRGWLRLSAHAYNEPADYERLASVGAVIRGWIASGPG